MSYFRELPNLEYQSPFATRVSSQQYVLVKNLFRRVKLREDLQNAFTVFDKYQIQDGDRPDTVAEKLYGKADLDWVVILSAGIVRIRDQWPLSSYQLYNYAENEYGNDLNAIHHYETTEVLDSQGRLILPAGNIVDSKFSFVYVDTGKNYSNSLSRISYPQISSEAATKDSQIIKVNQEKINVSNGDALSINGTYIPIVSSSNSVINNTNITTITLSSPIPIDISKGSTLTFKVNNTILIKENPVIGVTNYEYETRKNEEKRGIYILKNAYLQQYLNDMRSIMTYGNNKSSQFVDRKLIRTENTRNTMP